MPTVPELLDSSAFRTLESVVATLTAVLLPDDGPTATLRVQLPIVQVVPNGLRWQLLQFADRSHSVRGSFRTKDEAVRAGREEAERLGGTLAVHRSDRSLQQTYHYPSLSVDSARLNRDEEGGWDPVFKQVLGSPWVGPTEEA